MKKQIASTVLLLAALGTAGVSVADETYVPPTLSTLTRAEVQADLAAWRAAGLADVWRGDETPNIYSTEYRLKLARYQQLLAQKKANGTAN